MTRVTRVTAKTAGPRLGTCRASAALVSSMAMHAPCGRRRKGSVLLVFLVPGGGRGGSLVAVVMVVFFFLVVGGDVASGGAECGRPWPQSCVWIDGFFGHGYISVAQSMARWKIKDVKTFGSGVGRRRTGYVRAADGGDGGGVVSWGPSLSFSFPVSAVCVGNAGAGVYSSESRKGQRQKPGALSATSKRGPGLMKKL